MIVKVVNKRSQTLPLLLGDLDSGFDQQRLICYVCRLWDIVFR